MGDTLKPWYAVAIPHEDIREGHFSEAVFAADLWAVKKNEGPEIYRDTEAFFQKSYPTSGLTNVLRRVARALQGSADAGDRILSLQTSFGGGKTHILIALWHLAKNGDIIQKSDACRDIRNAIGELPVSSCNVAVFTNETCDPEQGRQTEEGILTRTLWGELALQLGGKSLYHKIQANDQARIAPKGLFVEILRQSAPCLILLDELADYCVAASGVKVEDSTLADQTISFVQELTGAVQQVPGVALVATLPASRMEVASSEKGQEILDGLERRLGRMSADIKPVADEEIYEVVRRRLFESLGEVKEQRKTIKAYMEIYRQHKNEVPAEAARNTYEERMLKAYPFHPALIDTFYLRWGSHGSFQRTRGVLRLLASIVGDIWQRRNTETQSQLLIQPSHIRWNIDALHSALTRLWGAPYEAVVAQDIIGEKANAAELDLERGGDYRNEKITQGIASTVLLGSFGGQGERSGLNANEIKLCVSRPGLNWNYTDGALVAFDERSFYLHSTSSGGAGKRYWFGTKPTLNRLIVQYRHQYAGKRFDDQIVELLQQEVRKIRLHPQHWRILVNPEADLAEQRSLTLLILHPDFAYSGNGLPKPLKQQLLSISQKCGNRERIYRNTLLFLLPSQRGLARLGEALREVAALNAVKQDYEAQLDGEQKAELSKRIPQAEKNVSENLCSTYIHIARVAQQDIVVTSISDAKSRLEEHIQGIWQHLLEEEEWILRRVGPVTLQNAGLVPSEGAIRVKDAVEAFLRYTDKHMITDRSAVLEGLRIACKNRVIGIGYGINSNSLHKKYCGEDPYLDPNEDGLWIIPPFEPDAIPGETGGTPPGEKTGETPPTPGAAGKPGEAPAPESVTGESLQRVHIHGNVSVENWAELFRCFVKPAVHLNLKSLQLRVDFELVPGTQQPLDANHPQIKAMKEAARQLGLEFEEE